MGDTVSVVLERSLYADLLGVATKDRQAHSVAVGRKAASAADRVTPYLRADLVAAATLHDIGYGHVVSGFHPLDGARFLPDAAFPATVGHLVAHHTASTYEADEVAQLVGHSGTTVTELVYRHQLRPVIQTGATVMDRLFAPGSGSS